jgi:hypothetical protein
MENTADVISKFSDSFYSIEKDFDKQTKLLEKKYVREVKNLTKDLKIRVFTKDNIDAFRNQVLEDERHFDFYPTVDSVTDKKSISLLSHYLIDISEEEESFEGSWINDYLPDEIILKQPQ